MSGFFKQATTEQDASQPSATPNIALKVRSYDVERNATTGVDIVTGEEMTIALRGLSKSFDKQSDVAQWSKPSGKKSVAAGEDGGVIVFESVVHDRETKQLTSRWGVVAAHDAAEAEVSKVYARPATSFTNRDQLDPKRAIEIARVEFAKPVSNETELKSAIADVLARPFTTAVVRAFDGEEVRSSVVWKSRDESAQDAATRFRQANAYLGRHLSDENIANAMQAVEVFPLERIYAGLDTREMLNDSSKLTAQRFSRDWALGEKQGWGFGESLVALRTHDEGGRYFAMMLPAVNRQPLWTLDSLPSANIKPAVAPALSADSGANATPQERAESSSPAAKSEEAPAAAVADAGPETSAVADRVASAASRLSFRRR